jgi:glycosyltransferase involved in cell wall biosynthesis
MIVIVAESGIGFPNGTAPTARIMGYAKGLRDAGREVLVLCLNASEPSPPATALNTHTRGVVDGVRFEYTSGRTVRQSRLWRRRLTKARGLFAAAARLRRLAAEGSLDAVLLYSKSPVDAVVIRLATRGRPLLAELCELPFPDARQGSPAAIRRDAYNRFFFRWFDGVVAISDLLRRHAQAFGRPGVAVLKVPVMTDVRQFRPASRTAGASRIVGYCGYLNQEKDGVVSLMEAFARIAPDLPRAELRLIGDWWKGTRIPEYRSIAESLGIGQTVAFLGNVPRAEIPELLNSCAVLVLARPRSAQADAGMPTKVAEYLASGVPTVLTRTGELETFLRAGEDAYLVPPGDVGALADALRHVLAHPEEAEAVGRRGREVAEKRFDYRTIGLQVSAFVADLDVRPAGRHPS